MTDEKPCEACDNEEYAEYQAHHALLAAKEAEIARLKAELDEWKGPPCVECGDPTNTTMVVTWHQKPYGPGHDTRRRRRPA